MHACGNDHTHVHLLISSFNPGPLLGGGGLLCCFPDALHKWRGPTVLQLVRCRGLTECALLAIVLQL